MKLVLLAGLLLVGMVHAAQAQSLDIGGIELRLGQKVDDALRSLSSYQVQYRRDFWMVTQGAGEFLGTFRATDNVITAIEKHFDMGGDEDATKEYTRASKEVRRRGGMTCVTRDVEYIEDLHRAFETQCGLYKLVYSMPSKLADGTPVGGAVYISIEEIDVP